MIEDSLDDIKSILRDIDSSLENLVNVERARGELIAYSILKDLYESGDYDMDAAREDLIRILRKRDKVEDRLHIPIRKGVNL